MRTRVLLIAIVVVTLLGPGALARAGDHGPACTPAGTWTMKTDFDFIPDPAKPTETQKFYLQYLQFFTADGRTTDLLPTGAGHPNVGDTRIGCVGEWRPRRSARPCEFEVVQRCLYNQAWDGMYGEIVGTIRVSRDGKKLRLKFSYIDYNGDGSVFWDEGTGVSYGTRLEFPPSK
ncbi:MAG: hypothetical protein U0599_02510 [Vicinamibacteria bacterium]